VSYFKHLKILFAAGLFFGIGFGASEYFSGDSQPIWTAGDFFEKRINKSGFQFINPLLECEVGSILSKGNKISYLKNSAEDLVEDILAKEKSIYRASVYYRDLNNGPWFGISEDEKFIPGSLHKVGPLIALLKEAELYPLIFNRKIIYGGSEIPEIETYFKPSEEVEENKAYTVGNLAERMIRFSDNKAAFLIAKIISADKLLKVYNELGLEQSDNLNDYPLSARQFSILFRILFNASYLSKQSSEAALSLLAQTQFDKGLRAGVPVEIRIAHKFGERISNDGKEYQLHDCGIVYAPEKPYLLCVMTKGKDFDKMAELIASVSKKVFSHVSE